MNLTDYKSPTERPADPKKIDFPFQEICIKLEPIFGKIVWSVVTEKGNTTAVMEEVYRRWTQEKRVGYLKWLIKEIKK